MVENRLCLHTEHSSLFSQLERDLLCDLCLLFEDGLFLSSETLLLVVVSTTALGEKAFFAFLVLRNFVLGVLLAVERAVGVARLCHFDHFIWYLLKHGSELKFKEF